MQENIIGYLLGALDDHEMAKFEAELDRNDDLQRRVQDAAHSLHILNFDAEDEEPPAGLVEATCMQVQAVSSRPQTRPHVRLRENRGAWAHDNESWSLFDMVVAAAVVLVGCMLLLPAVASSRLHSQIAGCQDNLRHIGKAFIEYSSHDPQGRFPQIPQTGNTSVAGIYAPIILEQGLVTDDYQFYCPSSPRFEKLDDRQIPKLSEVQSAFGPELVALQKELGGDYAYNLGWLKDGQLRRCRDRGRTDFVVLADDSFCGTRATRNGTRHQNLLFECGNVKMISNACSIWKGDDLYTDQYGRIQAGAHENDIVVGSSATRPVPSR